ncbi:hypothetical protein Hanom_Chr04g00303911 [Helianthus anomalus]
MLLLIPYCFCVLEQMKDGDNKNVLNTALHLAVGMKKKDWIQVNGSG